MTIDEELLLRFRLPNNLTEYNMGYVTYADDIATLKLARTAATLVRKSQHQDAKLDKICTPLLVHQNAGKQNGLCGVLWQRGQTTN
eukprot:4949880-Heterocapsa_arctica.AAC.1